VFIGSPDVLHDYAYVPDIARAATALLAAPDAAFGQAWHMPCAPTRTTRDILQIAADALDVKLRISALPAWMLGPSAMFSPLLRELKEMRFQWDRPYQVDASRFKAAFWSDVTPFETGIPATARRNRDPRDRARLSCRIKLEALNGVRLVEPRSSLRPPGFGTRGKQSRECWAPHGPLDRRVATLLAMTMPSMRSRL
jgi:hypothetical protein